MRLALAIESSCDETAAAVVEAGGAVRASVVSSQIPIHARYGGVVPELASRSHMTEMRPVVQGALAQAGVTLDDLDLVAVTAGPGLAGCLLVGVQTAKALAWARGLPLAAVDHIAAHIHAVFLRDGSGAGSNPPPYPHVALAVSGGHTSLYRVDAPGDTRLLGETLDDAAGEAFDKVAKMMGLPYPGGVEIDRLARAGDRGAKRLPRPMKNRGLDFSFSGLKTAVRYELEGGCPLTPPDLAASAQEAIVDTLVTKALRACKETGIHELVLAGGVAANSRLREVLHDRAAKRGVRTHLTPARYCTDNAAMVGGLGLAMAARGEVLRGADLLGLDIYTTRRRPRAEIG